MLLYVFIYLIVFGFFRVMKWGLTGEEKNSPACGSGKSFHGPFALFFKEF
jgi:hypothetical protein